MACGGWVEDARRSWGLLRGNPRYLSIQFKKVGKFWSVGAGISHRARGVFVGDVEVGELGEGRCSRLWWGGGRGVSLMVGMILVIMREQC